MTTILIPFMFTFGILNIVSPLMLFMQTNRDISEYVQWISEQPLQYIERLRTMQLSGIFFIISAIILAIL